MDKFKFKVGDKIYKPKGYKFDGTVVSVFETTSGEIRIVAELKDNGMLHIFSEKQLLLKENFFDSVKDYGKVHDCIGENSFKALASI